MAQKDKYEDRIQTVFSSCDAFSAGFSVVLMFFFLPYCLRFGSVAVLMCMPIVLLVPFVLMPLIYAAVHRFDTVLFGRYHLIMPVSAFVAALFFVLMFSANGMSPQSECLIFFGALVFAVTLLTYRYCAFSVRVRLYGNDITRLSLSSRIFMAAGSLTAIACVFGFYAYDSRTVYVNSAYTLAAAMCLCAVAQYLSTFYGIPRLGGKRVQSLKSAYRSLYGGLNTHTYFSSLLFLASFVLTVLLNVWLCSGELAPGGVTLMPPLWVAVIAFCAGFGAAIFIGTGLIDKRSKTLTVIVSLLLTASSALCVTAVLFGYALSIGGAPIYAAVICSALLAGVGGALALIQMRLRFVSIKPRITSGVMFILSELTKCAAAAIAVFIVGLCALTYEAAGAAVLFAGAGVAALAAVTAVIIAGKRIETNKPLVPTYEPRSAELGMASGSAEDKSDGIDAAADMESRIEHDGPSDTEKNTDQEEHIQ